MARWSSLSVKSIATTILARQPADLTLRVYPDGHRAGSMTGMVSRRPSAATEARDPSLPVDYETVIAMAADIADHEGWAAVTLSRVARAVDRHVTSMYSHVDSVAALRRGVALLAATEMAELLWGAALGRSREDALHAIADVYRSYPRDHPGRGEALLTYRGWEDDELHVQAMRMSDPLRATLRSFGLDDTQVE